MRLFLKDINCFSRTCGWESGVICRCGENIVSFASFGFTNMQCSIYAHLHSNSTRVSGPVNKLQLAVLQSVKASGSSEVGHHQPSVYL